MKDIIDNSIDHHEENSGEIVVVTPNKIFTADDFHCDEYNHWISIGEGKDFVTGAMKILYSTSMTEDALAKACHLALKIACTFSAFCGTPIKMRIYK